MITVKFFGSIRNWAEEKAIKIDKKNLKFRKLLNLVYDKVDDEFREKIEDDKGIKDFVIISVDGKNLESINNLETELEGDEEIRFAPSVAGGEFSFSERQIKRYSRHIVLSELGGEGQEKLLNSSVLVVGAGALASPVLLYLAAAGVGEIGIVDNDEVELSNLQRQIIHSTEDVGANKTESAKETIEAINQDVEVKTFRKRLEPQNARELIEGWDFVIDGSDNFPTKFLVNDASHLVGVPFSHAGILRFSGLTTTFLPDEGPCYRCLTPQPPSKDSVPSCQEAGVVGAFPGVIGSIQALEAIKHIIGSGDLLVGRALQFDALHMSFDEMKFSRNPDCPVCEGKLQELEEIDYKGSCRVKF
ncbi:adenylyltransferase [archaeon SCG-AAA382B04]|nr:adenylyltransferase [archaeon SCG-AAA382B04]